MYGTILGDMIGAPYEFDMGNKSKDFPLFSETSYPTDDSVMTTAIAEALIKSGINGSEEVVKGNIVISMQKWGRKYPDAGYGGMFAGWLLSHDPQPYGSYGNGSAMRVSSVGWLYDTLDRTREVARWTAEVTHNHPEGIKGAEATASAIYLARRGTKKGEIKKYIEDEFGYDLSRSCDEIRPTYYHVESCQETVPEAITAFLEGKDFEDVIRTAVSLGGDCDTLTCIAGSIAEAYYDIPREILDKGMSRMTQDMIDVASNFYKKIRLGIVDIHMHCIPFVDDGAKNLDDAMEMIYQAALQGVTDIICTSHSDAILVVGMKNYRERFELLRSECKKHYDGVRLYLGAEIFCESNNIDRMIDGLSCDALPTINGSNYVLVEFDPYETKETILICCRKLLNAGYIPIIAHTERFYELYQIDSVELLKEIGCKVQVNAYSLVDEQSMAIKGAACKLLSEHMIDFLGSDAHRPTHRPPKYETGINKIYQELSEREADLICFGNARRFFL